MNKTMTSVRGFSLITTLFLLVVVAGLAGYLVNLSISQQYSTALTLDGLRGRHAASSGSPTVSITFRAAVPRFPPI
jgi:MSHA biogenesis protein MshP